ncbi:uncharacterized protein LOC130648173 [Hydractinia symbiolongicarpus]|uniref:uncharacterized protein LOC130648173 n=1 Tax=Hydractinia symbiolongicarpus TaxID=13093 RepID=UPI00254BE128|nr:uncharacterized protein LOC130648173 [Hydractinia symbiolongicarpus]
MSIVTCLLLCENEKLCDRAMFKKRLDQHGDCWLIQENTTDAGEEMQRLREDESIESFKTLLRKMDPVAKVENQCIAIECKDSTFSCECTEEKWKLLKRNVCFEMSPQKFGTFKMLGDGHLQGVKLKYVNGTGILCSMEWEDTKWSCGGMKYARPDHIGVVVKDGQDKVIYPSSKYHIANHSYKVPGYNAYSPYLVFNASSHIINWGEILTLHFSETLTSAYENYNDVESNTCVDVFIDVMYLE